MVGPEDGAPRTTTEYRGESSYNYFRFPCWRAGNHQSIFSIFEVTRTHAHLHTHTQARTDRPTHARTHVHLHTHARTRTNMARNTCRVLSSMVSKGGRMYGSGGPGDVGACGTKYSTCRNIGVLGYRTACVWTKPTAAAPKSSAEYVPFLPYAGLQKEMMSSGERTSAKAEGYRIERSLMDCAL